MNYRVISSVTMYEKDKDYLDYLVVNESKQVPN